MKTRLVKAVQWLKQWGITLVVATAFVVMAAVMYLTDWLPTD